MLCRLLRDVCGRLCIENESEMKMDEDGGDVNDGNVDQRDEDDGERGRVGEKMSEWGGGDGR